MTTRAQDKLSAEAAHLVGADERILSVFLVQKGLRPGLEAVGGAVAGLLGLVGLMSSRRWFTAVVTDAGAYLLANRGMKHPIRVHSRLADGDSFGPVTGSGDYSMAIGEDTFWVPLPWLDEARRAARLRA